MYISVCVIACFTHPGSRSHVMRAQWMAWLFLFAFQLGISLAEVARGHADPRGTEEAAWSSARLSRHVLWHERVLLWKTAVLLQLCFRCSLAFLLADAPPSGSFCSLHGFSVQNTGVTRIAIPRQKSPCHIFSVQPLTSPPRLQWRMIFCSRSRLFATIFFPAPGKLGRRSLTAATLSYRLPAWDAT